MGHDTTVPWGEWEADDPLLLQPPQGGDLRLDNGTTVRGISPQTLTPDGVTFGAVGLTVPDGTTVAISRFEYRADGASFLGDLLGLPDVDVPDWDLPDIDLGWPLALGAAGLPIATADDAARESACTRRDVLAGAGLLLGGGALTLGTADARAATEDPHFTIVECDVTTNSRGLGLRLTNRMADVLPVDREYQLLHEGTPIGTLTPRAPTATLPPGRTGTVSVLTDADRSFWHDVRATLADETVEYTVDLPTPASELPTDEAQTVTTDNTLVEPVRDAGPDATIIEVGDESIQHVDEESSRFYDVGTWHLDAGTLIYTPGDDAPDARTVRVAAHVGTVAEAADDAERRLPA